MSILENLALNETVCWIANVMSNRDAIAVIEFSLEFDHFFNIDLYVGGYV